MQSKNLTIKHYIFSTILLVSIFSRIRNLKFTKVRKKVVANQKLVTNQTKTRIKVLNQSEIKRLHEIKDFISELSQDQRKKFIYKNCKKYYLKYRDEKFCPAIHNRDFDNFSEAAAIKKLRLSMSSENQSEDDSRQFTFEW